MYSNNKKWGLKFDISLQLTTFTSNYISKNAGDRETPDLLFLKNNQHCIRPNI